MGVACPDAPHSSGKDQHKEEEEDACNLQPENAAHPAKGAQKAAHASRQASAGLSGGASRSPFVCSLVRSGLVKRLSGGWSCSGLRSGIPGCGGHALAGHSPGDPQPDAQGAPYALRSHFVMMVAAPLAEPLFSAFFAIHSCSRTATAVR
jgi:hypothetical protein